MSNKYLKWYHNPEHNALYDEGFLDGLCALGDIDSELAQAKDFVRERLGNE